MNKYSRGGEYLGCFDCKLLIAFWPEEMNVSGKDVKDKLDLFLNTPANMLVYSLCSFTPVFQYC